MRKDRTFRTFIVLMMTFAVLFSFCGTLSANSMMPPTFCVGFSNPPDHNYYFAFLYYKSDDGSTGSDSISGGTDKAWDVTQGGEAFLPQVNGFIEGYSDPDGFVRHDSDVLICRDYTEAEFWGGLLSDREYRFLIYWPDSGEYKVTESFSLGEVNNIMIDLSEGSDLLSVKDLDFSYARSSVLRALACNLIITLTVELAVAFFFKLRSGKQMLTILITNIVTNVSVNLIAMMNVKDYIKLFIPLELAVLAVEALIYCIFFRKNEKVRKIISYTAVANILSATIGFFVFLFVLMWQGNG